MSKLADADTRDTYEALNENYFRYYLFYANTLVALIAVVTARALSSSVPLPHTADGMLVVLMIVLLLSAHESLKRFYSAAHQLLK